MCETWFSRVRVVPAQDIVFSFMFNMFICIFTCCFQLERSGQIAQGLQHNPSQVCNTRRHDTKFGCQHPDWQSNDKQNKQHGL